MAPAARAGWRRPDILLYVNGLPLVFIELKNASVKLRTAYDDNLTNYKVDIPQLFLTNALCVFSNGIETRIGSLSDEVGAVLDEYLPEDSYDKGLFIEKRDKVFELTLDLAINHQRWAA